jgi:hypothetical protein
MNTLALEADNVIVAQVVHGGVDAEWCGALQGGKGMIETKEMTTHSLNTTETASLLPATPKANLIIEIARRLLALHDWLGGPPMTERERIQREIAAAQRECRIFHDSLNLPDR